VSPDQALEEAPPAFSPGRARRYLELGSFLTARRPAAIEAGRVIGSQAVFALATLLGVRLLSDLMPPRLTARLGIWSGS
jgi:hypothetical protein